MFSRTHTALDNEAYRFSATQTVSDFPLKMEHVRKNTAMTSVVDSGVKGDPRMTLAHALVYVIDDDMSVRRAIGRLLESEDYSVELLLGAREFLARAPHTGPSCVILDLNLPGLNGLELQEALLARGRTEQIIFITGGATVPSCVEAMKAGALDYLLKPFDDENLLSAVKRALERSCDQWLQRSLRKEVRDRLATLTTRECDVLKGVVAGMLNKQIAAEFGTTEGTIKVHRGRVMEKMGATSVAELVILAQRAGIAPTSTDATKI